MNRAVVAAVALFATTSARGPVRADDTPPVEPTVTRLAEANLEPVDRQGVIVAAGVVTELAVGLGSRGGVTTGGGIVARLGKYASPTTILLAEVDLGSTFHRAAGGGGIATNSDGALAIGAIHFVAPSLWLRAELGWAVYVRDDELVDGSAVARETLPGGYAALGAGLELVRWRARALAVELYTSSIAHAHGLVTMSGAGLSLSL